MASKKQMAGAAQAISHNLLGQRLGRKGLETRERIIQATLRLLERPGEPLLTMSSVAREASTGMTTLYLYFPDLGDLILAACHRVMEEANQAYMERLRDRWPDEELYDRCIDFLHAHAAFWARHARIMQMRNSYADVSDVRFVEFWNEMSCPIIELLVRQMDAGSGPRRTEALPMAGVLLIGFERLSVSLTTSNFRVAVRTAGVEDEVAHGERLLSGQARLMALAIREQRAAGASGRKMAEVAGRSVQGD